MTIHLLVEGASENVLFEQWCPRVLPGQRVRVHPHQGKGELPSNVHARPDPKRRGLLDQLPAKLRGFASSSAKYADFVVVVLDADEEDPEALAARINSAAEEVAPALSVVVSVAVEETEAFYLGDLRALAKAFPSADLEKARQYEPDSVCDTWELFGEIIGDGGGNKVAWAEAMAPVLTTKASASRSPSFRSLVAALQACLPTTQPKSRPRKYRHPTRKRKNSGRRRT